MFLALFLLHLHGRCKQSANESTFVSIIFFGDDVCELSLALLPPENSIIIPFLEIRMHLGQEDGD